MSPAKNKVQIVFHVSPDEREIIKRLAGKNQSVYLRGLIRRDAKARGIEWPGDTSDTRGQYPRYPCPQCGGWNIGRCDDEPCCADCGWGAS